tara:strand:- start:634 stop:753 length:120 start_codon:yes stop_codon:yes gene_type:complete
MSKPTKKRCYYCHTEKPISEMKEMGVWVCDTCLNKTKKK